MNKKVQQRTDLSFRNMNMLWSVQPCVTCLQFGKRSPDPRVIFSQVCIRLVLPPHTNINLSSPKAQWPVLHLQAGEKKKREGRGGGRLVSEEGIRTPTSILIKQICHKSFYKCPVGGYRGWWKYPIHALSSPAGLKPRLLARLSVLTASDPPAICRVGWPELRGLCVLTLRRRRRRKKENLKVKDPPPPVITLPHLQHTQIKLWSQNGKEQSS